MTLLPCPFCGNQPDYESADSFTGIEGTGFAKWGAVQCGCGVIGSDVRTGYKSFEHWREAAAREWNTRVSVDEESITHIIKLSARVAALEHTLRSLSAIGFAASDAGCEQELIVRAALNQETQNA